MQKCIQHQNDTQHGRMAEQRMHLLHPPQQPVGGKYICQYVDRRKKYCKHTYVSSLFDSNTGQEKRAERNVSGTLLPGIHQSFFSMISNSSRLRFRQRQPFASCCRNRTNPQAPCSGGRSGLSSFRCNVRRRIRSAGTFLRRRSDHPHF